MTLVTGQVRFPYGSPEGTGADGCVSFTQTALGFRGGAIFVPATISTTIKDGMMSPVELTPGLWAVTITVNNRSHSMTNVLIEGQETSLATVELPADGTYFLKLENNMSITHTGDGSYEIGEANE